MKLLDTNINQKFPDQFKDLCSYIDVSTVSDINAQLNIYI